MEAVIFDMDGVLLDSEPLHHAVCNDLLAPHGARLDDVAYRRYLGTTLDYTWEDLIRRFSLPQGLAYYRERYDLAILESYRLHSVPAPGAVALVAALRQVGLKLAVASSSRTSWVETALTALGLAGQFGTVVTGDMIARSKPDPEIYLLAAEQLAVAPARCVAVEDAPAGVASAKAAGMTVIGVRTIYTVDRPLADADVLVDGLDQVDLAALGIG